MTVEPAPPLFGKKKLQKLKRNSNAEALSEDPHDLDGGNPMNLISQERFEDDPVTVTEDDSDEMCKADDDEEKSEIVPGNDKVHTWTYSNRYFYLVAAYTIQKLIKKIGKDILIVQSAEVYDFEYDYMKSENIVSEGAMVFVYEDIIYAVGFSFKYAFCSIKSNYDTSKIVDMFDHEIKWNNPLRYKNLYVTTDSGNVSCEFKKAPTITFDNVILPKKTMEEVYDNTIFQIKNVKGTNGIILHGPPGGGKSLCCQAVISTAIAEKINTCFTTSHCDYVQVSRLIETFLNPCIMILEDVDAIAVDREKFHGAQIAGFLQFLSGLSEMESNMVFMATTNHLDHLDKAVRSRPMRFNRKIEFGYPTPDEIDRLIDLYFSGYNITADMKKLCHVTEFTGAHVKEIKRTAELYSKKHNTTIEQEFPEAVAVIKVNFSVKENYVRDMVT